MKEIFLEKKEPRLSHGRSMIEMLGVLAIVGVLSVTALIGFRSLMDRRNANETMNELEMRYLSVIEKDSSDFSMSPFADKTMTGYPVALQKVKADTFMIVVSQVPSGVCRHILRLNWRQPSAVYVNASLYQQSESICESDNSILQFVFGDAAATNTCESNADCVSACQVCGAEGLCVEKCNAGFACARSFNMGGQEKCCPSQNIINGVCCETPGDNGSCCGGDVSHCCPIDKPLSTAEGECFACDYEGRVHLDANAVCKRCPNRILHRDEFMYCPLTVCPPDKPIRGGINGVCYACDEAGDIRVRGYSQAYYPSGLQPDPESCLKCPNRVLKSEDSICSTSCPAGTTVKDGRCVCPDDKPLLDKHGVCHACNESAPISLWQNESSCSVCDGSGPGREARKLFTVFTGYTVYCGLDVCTPGQYQDARGGCYECTDTQDFYQKYVSGIASVDCEVGCAGIRFKRDSGLHITFCKLCSRYLSSLNETECLACKRTWNSVQNKCE